MTNTKLPISVILVIKNEEKNLPIVLPLLEPFNEVIIIDSQSADKSLAIIEKFGYPVYQFHWNGVFPKKRNWALRNVPIKNDWVLFLDADEYFTPEFLNGLRKEFAYPSDKVGYWLQYSTLFLGKELKHGVVSKKLALFRKSAGEYERIEDDSLEGNYAGLEIHEHPILDGPIGEIPGKIFHNEDRGIAHYIKKHNEYSSWEVRRYFKLTYEAKQELTFHQKVKYRLMDSWILGSLYFIYLYFFKLGFLDGKRGYILAKRKKEYFHNIKAKLEEEKLKRQNNHN